MSGGAGHPGCSWAGSGLAPEAGSLCLHVVLYLGSCQHFLLLIKKLILGLRGTALPQSHVTPPLTITLVKMLSPNKVRF